MKLQSILDHAEKHGFFMFRRRILLENNRKIIVLCKKLQTYLKISTPCQKSDEKNKID